MFYVIPRSRYLFGGVLCSALPFTSWAAGLPGRTVEEVVVTGTQIIDLVGSSDSASEGTVFAAQVENRPILRTGEVLEVVPGLIITQHSGDGKANQFFLRGSNLDHGTDFASAWKACPSTCRRTRMDKATATSTS